MRNRTSDLRISRSDALPLSHRDSTVSEVYYEVHLTSVLHSPASISNVDSVMFVDRNKRDVKFWARKINRERCFSSCHERETSEYRFDIEHRSAVSEGLRFGSSKDSEFFLCLTLVTRRKTILSSSWIFFAVWRCPILQKVNKTFSAEKQKNEQGMSFQCFWQKWNFAKLPHPNLF